MKTKNNFDSIAWCYDFLSSIVFGDKIKNSQIILLNKIKDHDRVLIIGGGTGWIIDEVFKLKKTNTIDYVEVSKSMLEKARSITSLYPDGVVNFIHGNENSIGEEAVYDIIITCYFFDQFQPERLEYIISKLVAVVKPGGKLLVADFNLSLSSPIKHKVLVKSMYLFFYITCRLEIKRLVKFQEVLEKVHLIRENSFSTCNGLMLSEVYRKEALIL
ncbi:MAG TPA: methyltransferase [Cytophagaceae bacterium]|nr:methyltransferase [Cytophagaceae bacterium]